MPKRKSQQEVLEPNEELDERFNKLEDKITQKLNLFKQSMDNTNKRIMDKLSLLERDGQYDVALAYSSGHCERVSVPILCDERRCVLYKHLRYQCHVSLRQSAVGKGLE